MAVVRVFLPTYQRPAFLARALASLRAQTFTDWVCEVHDNDPTMTESRALIEATGDSRLIYRQHDRNLGGTASYNLAFAPIEEPFRSLHEDDNSWRPEFLEKMLEAAGRFPQATVFWSNMRLWEEQPDGSLTDEGRCVWPETDGPPRPVAWGHPLQIFGALHSSGATLIRNRPGHAYVTPPVPMNMIEGFRERMFPHPLVFVPQPLANYVHTRGTSRARDSREWALYQTMQAASFLVCAGYDDAKLAEVWGAARRNRPPQTNALLLAALAHEGCRALGRYATIGDWARFVRGCVRRPRALPYMLRSRRDHADWWDFIETHTRARFEEARIGETGARA